MSEKKIKAIEVILNNEYRSLHSLQSEKVAIETKIKEIDFLEKKNEELDISIKIKNENIQSLNNDFSSLGGDPASIKKETSQNNLVLSDDHTLEILKQIDSSEGTQIKNIISEYAKIGILTYDRIITEQIKNLMEKHLIYQMNPNAQRKKRFRVESKI